ncbi:hypothetical protein LBMAG42_13420 [Deltaproteobacteria bacterium]|nr:hypothetical protein LBMAG42_13420 [Deltaproteobacteria bacterium]
MTVLFFVYAAAAAPSGFFDLGFVLKGAGAFQNGVGAPSVEWRGDTEEYVMYFEAATDAEDVPEGCANSFHIGRATSPDGVTWALDEAPVLTASGVAGTPRECSVAQPAILFDGTQWNLFYSASKLPNEGAATNAPSGIGWATSADGIAWTVVEEVLVPFVDTSIGLSSAAALNGVVYLEVAELPDIFQLSRPVGSSTWSEPVRVLDHLSVGEWAGHWVHGPSLVCDEAASRPLAMLFGGDTEGTFERGLGWAESADGVSWAVDTNSPLAGGNLDYSALNHWDVLRSGAGYVVWYSRTDEESGEKAVGAAVTDTQLGDPAPRACPSPWAVEEDTGSVDTGVGDTGDTAGDDGEDTDEPAESGDCGCASGGPVAGLVGVGLGLLLLGTRRR